VCVVRTTTRNQLGNETRGMGATAAVLATVMCTTLIAGAVRGAMILQSGFAQKGRAQASSPTRREKNKREKDRVDTRPQWRDNVRNGGGAQHSGGCSGEGDSPLVSSGADGARRTNGMVNGGGGGGQVAVSY